MDGDDMDDLGVSAADKQGLLALVGELKVPG